MNSKILTLNGVMVVFFFCLGSWWGRGEVLGQDKVLVSSSAISGKLHRVFSAEEANQFQPASGDTVLLMGSNWKDAQLNLRAQAASGQVIVYMAAVHHNDSTKRMVFSGNSFIHIRGKGIEVHGIQFEGGHAGKETVVYFWAGSSGCRISNLGIVDYNPDSITVRNHWVVMDGVFNRVDHCFFAGKTNIGCTLAVNNRQSPNYHRIDHNYFAHRPELGENGGESIRIGTSHWSLFASHTVVENNIFDRCDGEIEIISNKSCGNIIRNNLFYRSNGMLTLRHGNGAEVYGNIFQGNGVKGSGGVRVIGTDHLIHCNYFSGLRGSGSSSVLALVNAWVNPPLHGYWPVKRLYFERNFIENCAEVVCVGAGKNEAGVVAPHQSFLRHNFILNSTTPIKWLETSIQNNEQALSLQQNQIGNLTEKEKISALEKWKKLTSSCPHRHYGVPFLVNDNIGPFGLMQDKKFVPNLLIP
jgi:poly(beta-D-mannuronate) lyase